jgi:hypothetical protein
MSSSKVVEWRKLVKQTYHAGVARNKFYTFRQALKDASKLRGKKSSSTKRHKKMHKKSKAKTHSRRSRRRKRRGGEGEEREEDVDVEGGDEEGVEEE